MICHPHGERKLIGAGLDAGVSQRKVNNCSSPLRISITPSQRAFFSHTKKKIPFLANICSKFEKCVNNRVVIERWTRLFQQLEHKAIISEYTIRSTQLPHLLLVNVIRAGLVEHNDYFSALTVHRHWSRGPIEVVNELSLEPSKTRGHEGPTYKTVCALVQTVFYGIA